nr:hypothetical protein [Tanacetum cinerariifolium]
MVGLSTMLESSGDEESLGKDASKQKRRINVIDVDEDITMVSAVDNEMFSVDVLGSEAVFVAGQNENVVEEVVDVAQVSTAATTVTITTKEITLAQALEALKTSKSNVKGIVFQEPEKRRKHFATKRAEEKKNRSPTQAQQRKIMCTYLKNMEGYTLKWLKLFKFDRIQEMFDRAFKRKKVEDDKETTKLKQFMEIIPNKEEVAIDAIPLAVKSPRIVDWKIHKEEKKSYYQIVRADRKS